MDNQAAIKVALSPAQAPPRKFIDIKYHYIQEHSNKETVASHYLPSTEILADIMTKSTKPSTFSILTQALQLELSALLYLGVIRCATELNRVTNTKKCGVGNRQ